MAFVVDRKKIVKCDDRDWTTFTRSRLGKMSNEQLVLTCEEENLDCTGGKGELVERLLQIRDETMLTRDHLEKMSRRNLVALCKEKKLSWAGVKRDLVESLSQLRLKQTNKGTSAKVSSSSDVLKDDGTMGTPDRADSKGDNFFIKIQQTIQIGM